MNRSSKTRRTKTPISFASVEPRIALAADFGTAMPADMLFNYQDAFHADLSTPQGNVFVTENMYWQSLSDEHAFLEGINDFELYGEHSEGFETSFDEYAFGDMGPWEFMEYENESFWSGDPYFAEGNHPLDFFPWGFAEIDANELFEPQRFFEETFLPGELFPIDHFDVVFDEPVEIVPIESDYDEALEFTSGVELPQLTQSELDFLGPEISDGFSPIEIDLPFISLNGPDNFFAEPIDVEIEIEIESPEPTGQISFRTQPATSNPLTARAPAQPSRTLPQTVGSGQPVDASNLDDGNRNTQQNDTLVIRQLVATIAELPTQQDMQTREPTVFLNHEITEHGVDSSSPAATSELQLMTPAVRELGIHLLNDLDRFSAHLPNVHIDTASTLDETRYELADSVQSQAWALLANDTADPELASNEIGSSVSRQLLGFPIDPLGETVAFNIFEAVTTGDSELSPSSADNEFSLAGIPAWSATIAAAGTLGWMFVHRWYAAKTDTTQARESALHGSRATNANSPTVRAAVRWSNN